METADFNSLSSRYNLYQRHREAGTRASRGFFQVYASSAIHKAQAWFGILACTVGEMSARFAVNAVAALYTAVISSLFPDVE